MSWKSLSLLAALSTFAATAAHAQESMARPHEQRLEPGDSVTVMVWRNPELSGGFRVAADGGLQHPLYRSVKVANVPLDSARARLDTVLRRYIQNPEFVMEPYFRVIVMGDVRAPGAYALPRQATVIQALAAAGGPLETAQLDRVALIRGGQTITTNLQQYTDSVGRSIILSGDQIVVPRRKDIWRNYIAPTASVFAALASLTTIFVRLR